jgi:hypothetical protein
MSEADTYERGWDEGYQWAQEEAQGSPFDITPHTHICPNHGNWPCYPTNCSIPLTRECFLEMS